MKINENRKYTMHNIINTFTFGSTIMPLAITDNNNNNIFYADG